MATLIAWSSIELLHNVIRYFESMKRELGQPIPKVTYRTKVKLHGTNCAIQMTSEGIFAQGRTILLTPQVDNLGFAKWVEKHENYWKSLPEDHVVYGEWAGPGVEPGMAISAVSEKVFAVFALQVGWGESARVVYDPEEIADYLHGTSVWMPKNLYILPWQDGEDVAVDFNDRSSLDAAAVELNRRILDVEKEDPWVKSTFGISGLGEGLVLYPVSVEGGLLPTDPEGVSHLMWKAKGDKHRNIHTKEAVQIDTSVVATTDEFVTLMVTEARLEQGVSAVCGGPLRDKKSTGKFLLWIVSDVKKESVAELEASGLTWAQVEKAVQVRAREWYLA